MEKVSMKFAFIVFLALTSVMSIVVVQNVEAKRLLAEETLQVMLHDEVLPQVAQPQDFHCREGCHVSCVPIQLVIRCVCLC
ncbi:unnamed protein product [Thlaspi arvense]|uniref:Transmembrane protein n=1 Tax=Thlaspi arvense TaxID=13288 RepID=A0AAU9S5Y0_THLAR|nr:unnamed protein product [Thlaspi arvense]